MVKIGKAIETPVPIQRFHSISDFHSGEQVLDEWLQHRALKNEKERAPRTFVACTEQTVVGYYSLSAGAISHTIAPGNIRRNMPTPIPALVLGRLAVHQDWQGKRLGYSLLQDALLRSVSASDHIGVRVILVHAISSEAKHFYQYFGFKESSIEPMTLMLPVKDILKSV